MKFSKKLRLFFSLTSLLVCFSISSLSVKADELEMITEEMTTTVDDTIFYQDGKITLANIKYMFESYAQTLTSLSYEELEYHDLWYGSQMDIFANFAEVAGEEGCGTYVGCKDITVTETKDSAILKISGIIDCSDKDVKMTFGLACFDSLSSPQLTTTEFSLAGQEQKSQGEETMKEKLTSAALNTVVGMGTVFVVLIFISLIIYCFNFIPKIQAVFSKKKEDVFEEEVFPNTFTEEEKAVSDDTQLIAVIAAAIAASENTTTDSFVVRSIRKR